MTKLNKIAIILPLFFSLGASQKTMTLREAYGERANAGAKLSKFMTPIQMATASVYYQAQKEQHGTPVVVHSKEESVQLFHNNNGFRVVANSKAHDIEPAMMDRQLRTITSAQLAVLQQKGLITVGRTADGHYTLSSRVNGNGGGIWGATIGCYLGKGLVYLVGHGGIQIAALCTGPAYSGTVIVLEAWLAAPIEAASNAAAVAGGVIGGVVTGPV